MRTFEFSSADGGGPYFGSASTTRNDTAHRDTRRREGTLVVACPIPDGERRIREFEETFAVCGVTERRALEQVMANLQPDVLVVDLTLPGLGRVRGLRAILRESPATRILALTDIPSEREGVFALKAGARAYCPRTIGVETLKKAVAAVQQGEIWAPRNLVPGLVAELVSLIDGSENQRPGPSKPRCGLKNLTERQRVVAELITKGASNKEIGNRLNITERTVKAHLTKTFQAVGVSGRLELAILMQGYPYASGD